MGPAGSCYAKDGPVIKELLAKAFSKPAKAGTKVRNIRLVEGEHDIDRRIEGFGANALKRIHERKA